MQNRYINPMEHVIDEILVDQSQMEQILSDTAKKVSDEYKNASDVVVLYILEGARNFTDALLDESLASQNKFTVLPIKASSYYNQTSSCGVVKIDLLEAQNVLKDKHVLIIDDIFDTGKTLTRVVEEIEKHNPLSVKTCVMVDRYCDQERGMEVDFRGVTLDSDAFLIGFGLDYKGELRNLPYIASVKKEYCC